MNNPFTLSFGLEPASYIAREQQTNQVIHSFTGDPSPSHLYMISGIRGAGKALKSLRLQRAQGKQQA